MKIYKYPLAVAARQEVQMPFGAEIVHCALQDDGICLWAIINDAPVRTLEVIRYFKVVGTGHHFEGKPSTVDYIGSVQQGQFVWHVLEMML